MDYGQRSQNQEREAFFTTGVGNLPASRNADSDNLDTGPNINWGAPERNPAIIGNKIINFPRQTQEQDQEKPSEFNTNVNLGEIQPIERQPVADQPTNANPPDFNTKVIYTGEHLNPAAIDEINRVETKLSKDGDAADFYEAAREMTEANLKNSFGRKVA